jgi:hypothetical protein
MSHRRTPPELRRKTWAEGTVWELLVAGELLPHRHASPFADMGLTKRRRRKLQEEKELLQRTQVSYILPRRGTTHRPPQPWLFVKVGRGVYRVGERGEIERFGSRTLHFGSGSITEHGWYFSTLRGARWLRVVAEGRATQRAAEVVELPPLAPEAQLQLWPTGMPGEASNQP